MRVIGLTGNIATGKSMVAGMLEKLGARIIDADRVAREVVKPGETAWEEIVEKFGRKILNDDSTINRGKLGEIVFNDEARRKALNDITHPKIIGAIKELVAGYKREDVPVVVIEAALIVEKGGLKDIVDSLIVVVSSEESQIERLRARNGYSREEALARINSQMPSAEKARHADYLIDNSGTIESTEAQVKSVWQKINIKNKGS